MSVAAKVLSLLDTLTKASLDQLNPAQRRQFAATCRFWAEVAEPPAARATPKSGVLSDLRNGAPRHE
jgi:hypothetical protein